MREQKQKQNTFESLLNQANTHSCVPSACIPKTVGVKTIPTFHKKRSESLLGSRFRTQFIMKKVFKTKEHSLLSNADIDTLIQKMCEHATVEFDGRVSASFCFFSNCRC